VRSLGRAAVQSTPEAIAASICDGMLEVDGVASAAIVWFSGAGPALTLAATGGTSSPLLAGQALPGALGRYLGVRASVGPWIEVGDVDPDSDEASTTLLLGGNTACAPIGARTQCIGVLLLGIEPDASLRAAHSVLSAAIDFAGPAEEMLRESLHQRNMRRGSWLEIATIVAEGLYQTHYQPVVRLDDRQVVGHEALTRFADGSGSEDRFIQASAFGRGLELEEATLTRALSSCAHLPPGTWLGLNVSPKMMLEVDYLHPLIEGTGRDVVLELSEHEPVEDYAELRSAVDRLAGEMLLSVDDAGAGFASLRHVLLLRPTFMKLDRSWTQGVDTDPAKTALVAGLQSYASKTGCRLIAEGIETEGQLEVLAELGVELGQGYLLGRPTGAPGEAQRVIPTAPAPLG
jgi:EAL domain-containing protein (putative c-di-GMP-specific phosphodiesterase class I)